MKTRFANKTELTRQPCNRNMMHIRASSSNGMLKRHPSASRLPEFTREILEHVGAIRHTRLSVVALFDDDECEAW